MKRFKYLDCFFKLKMKKYFLFVFFLMLFSGFVSGALIRGTVYDMSLDKKSDVIVTVDSSPKQAIIAEDGNYEFSLPIGNYTIKADYYENQVLYSSSRESILIENDKGFYKLDIVLLPVIEGEVSNNVKEEKEDHTLEIILVLVLVIVLIIVGYLIYRKKSKDVVLYSTVNQVPVSVNYETEAKVEEKVEEKVEKEEKSYHSELVEKVLEFIKNQGGSTTRKEIRKNFTSSEAKISLVITELVDTDKIKKIKKGRGNVIVLKDGENS